AVTVAPTLASSSLARRRPDPGQAGTIRAPALLAQLVEHLHGRRGRLENPGAASILTVTMGASAGGHPFPPMSERWAAILRGDHPLCFAQRAGRRAFALLPSPWRCKFCNAPFKGPASGIVHW